MHDLMAFIGGMTGGIIALVGQYAIARYKLKRAAKKELPGLNISIPGLSLNITDKELSGICLEMKKQGISLPPEAEEFLRRHTTVRP